MKQLKTWVAAVAVASLICLAGCAADQEERGAGEEEAVRVAFVSDTEGIEDGGFNQLGVDGLERAGKELGVAVRVVESASASEYETNLSALAEGDYDLVIASGFNLIEAVAAASANFPETDFAIIDIPHSAVPESGDNLMGLPFDQEPAGVLAGYLAGLVALEEAGPRAKIGAIGGQEIPPVASWLKGFRDGVAEAGPRLEVLEEYSGTFGKPGRCKAIARRQIAAGVAMIFEAAAGCGVAAIETAGEHDVLAIGTDGEYFDLGPHVLASGLKRTDVAVFETISSYLDGEFNGGGDRLFTIEDGGVGLSELSDAVPDRIATKVEARRAALAD